MFKPFTEEEINEAKSMLYKKNIFSAKVEFEKNKENIFKALDEGYKNRFVWTMLKERKEFNYSYGTFLRVLRNAKEDLNK